MREKVGKSRFTVFFQWFVAPGRSKSRLAKAAGAEPSGQRRDEKLHAVVARSTFGSQNVQNTPLSDHFWKLRCRKSARPSWREAHFEVKMLKHHMFAPLLEVEMSKKCTRCGAKHISKSKCTKHTMLGPLLEVEMSKKCTPLWREAHFQVKMYKAHHSRTTFGSSDSKKCTPLWREAHFEVNMYKTPHVRATFGSWDVEKVHAVVARSTFRSQNVQSTTCSRHFWRFRCRFASLHYTTLHTLHYTPLHYAPLHYTTLHNTTTTTTQLHSTTLHYTPLH